MRADLFPTLSGLHRLYQQACRLACAAIERGDFPMADRFGALVLGLERALEGRGEVI